MNLIFEKVEAFEKEKIESIYNVLKKNGEYMFFHEGLIHWKSPYPIESITENCIEKEVFLVKSLDDMKYIHTFQLENKKFHLTEYFKMEINGVQDRIHNVVVINKFATLPEFHGKGVGKQSLNFIENYCLKNNIEFLLLDVYEKSSKAIRFYKNRGFEIIRTIPTKHFFVHEMLKKL